METSLVEIVHVFHKIELIVNNKQKTHFRKAFGCARLAYNWGLSKWQDYYKQGVKKTHLDLKKEFNAIKKKEFPFVYEVSKYATLQPFFNLNAAFNKFFRDLKKGKVSYPRFKKKRDNVGSYYLGGDQVELSYTNKTSPKLEALTKDSKAQYLKIPKLGYVKLTEHVRFQGKINNVTISQKAGRFYASFNIAMPRAALPTHPPSPLGLGIDVGIKSMVSLSNGFAVSPPKPLAKLSQKLTRLNRQLSKKQHPKTKGDKTTKSANYKKASLKVARCHQHIANVRIDFLHKLTSLLIRHTGYFGLEDLNVKGMMANHRLAKALADVSFAKFSILLEYKAKHHRRQIVLAPPFYPSSKRCSCCGEIKADLTLSERIYQCPHCQAKLDRDYNAALNLFSLLTQQIGQVLPEFTPVDFMAMQDDFIKNQLVTSKVETGIQLK